MLSSAEVQTIAEELFAQHERKEPFVPFPDRVPTMDDACKIQDAHVALLTKRLNTTVAGYKVALTSKSTRDWLKIDEPCIGQVLGNRIHQSPHTVHLTDYVRFSMETEICCVMDKDMAGDCTIEDVRNNLRSIHTSYELVEDRGADLTRLDAHSLVSDNSWNGGIVIGPAVDLPAGLELNGIAGNLKRDGKPDGSGKTDDPLGALAWLANLAAEQGRPMTAGMVVITGSVITTLDVAPGERLDFTLEGVGSTAMTAV